MMNVSHTIKLAVVALLLVASVVVTLNSSSNVSDESNPLDSNRFLLIH
jgi:hypothetical protein